MTEDLIIKISEKIETERFVCVICLGFIEAIKKEQHSIYELICPFISPYSAQLLKQKGVNEELVTIIHLLCELDNVERVMPDKLGISIDEAKNRLLGFVSSLYKPKLPRERWIQNN